MDDVCTMYVAAGSSERTCLAVYRNNRGRGVDTREKRERGGRVRLGGSGMGKWVLGLKHGARFQV